MHSHNFIDLTGMKFGRLVVLKYDAETSKIKGRSYWICKCDCGKIKSVQSNELRTGGTISCGCYSIDIHSKSNKIEFDRELNCYRCYFIESSEYFLFDLGDLDIIQEYCLWI